jgi:hypothetical protein
VDLKCTSPAWGAKQVLVYAAFAGTSFGGSWPPWRLEDSACRIRTIRKVAMRSIVISR